MYRINASNTQSQFQQNYRLYQYVPELFTPNFTRSVTGVEISVDNVPTGSYYYSFNPVTTTSPVYFESFFYQNGQWQYDGNGSGQSIYFTHLMLEQDLIYTHLGSYNNNGILLDVEGEPTGGQDEFGNYSQGFISQITGLVMPPQFSNSWQKINTLDTTQTTPPKFKIPLGELYSTAVEPFKTNPINGQSTGIPMYSNSGGGSGYEGTIQSNFDEEIFVDFAILETFSYGGYNLVEYFRMLLSAGFVITTALYVWRKIIPRNALD
jgi:hypothetical protein